MTKTIFDRRNCLPVLFSGWGRAGFCCKTFRFPLLCESLRPPPYLQWMNFLSCASRENPSPWRLWRWLTAKNMRSWIFWSSAAPERGCQWFVVAQRVFLLLLFISVNSFWPYFFQTEKLKLFCKGADSVIYERLGPKQPFLDKTTAHLEEFALEGLRTLCIAEADLEEEVYQQWQKKYKEASTALVNRIQAVTRLTHTCSTFFTLTQLSSCALAWERLRRDWDQPLFARGNRNRRQTSRRGPCRYCRFDELGN